jgi:signal peptide peptidase SppA
MFTKISGGVSTQIIKADFRQAMADPDVQSILLVIDSPGGTVDGTEELAAEISAARGAKHIIAYTDGIMASAAYWIGSAADAIYISGDTAWVGSIGVVTSHVDYSGWESQQGIKTTEVYAGKYKRIDSEYAPLSEAGKEYLQAQVDYIYSAFARTVAAHRSKAGLTIPSEGETIPWADGKIFIGSQAIEQGLADGVSTIDQLIDDMAHGRTTGPVQLRTRLEREKNALLAQLTLQQGGTL